MKALIKNLITLTLYSIMFFLVNTKLIKIDTKKSIGISFIMGFFAGLLNAIFQETCTISDKVKSNDVTASDIS